MILFDVNVLLNAHFPGQNHHLVARRELERSAHSDEPFGLSELVLSAFVRIATNARAFATPAPLPVALAVCDHLRGHPRARVLAAGPAHWDLFCGLCTAAEARGPLVADAYHAALAIEHGCEWVSFDRDFAKFRGLRWRSPLD